MDFCKTGIGDAVSEGTEGFSEREEAAETLEIVVQLRRGVEISSFTTFPLHFSVLFFVFRCAGFLCFPFTPFFSFSFLSPCACFLVFVLYTSVVCVLWRCVACSAGGCQVCLCVRVFCCGLILSVRGVDAWAGTGVWV